MYAFLPSHFRVEGGGQQMAGTHCNNSSRPGQGSRVGRVFRIRRFHLGEDLHARTDPLHPRTADEHRVNRGHT